MKTVPFTLLIMFLTGAPVLSQDFVTSAADKTGGATRDFLQRRIVVTGRGASKSGASSLAEKRMWALVEARKNCISHAAVALGDISFESVTRMSGNRLESTNVSLKINNFICGIKNLDEQTETLPDGSVLATVTMVIDFDGNRSLNNLLFNELFPPEVLSSHEISPPDDSAAGEDNGITGFVFDVRDVKIKPSLTARIYSETGELLYGPGRVSREYAIKYGVVGYTKDVGNVTGRIGYNPLLVEIMSLKEGDAASIVVSRKEAEKLKRADRKHRLFTECRVAFLIK